MTARGSGGEYGVVQLSAARRGSPAERPESTTETGAPAAITLDGVYRTHARFVWRVAAQLIHPHEGTEVDDVVHDVFLIVQRRLSQFDRGKDVRSWLYGITRNVVALHRRGRERARRRVQGVVPPGAPIDPERVAQHGEVAAAMARFLEQLDEDQRVVFVLVEVEEMTAPEVAAVVGAPVNTVYSRLRLARRRFDRFAKAWRSP